MKSKRGDAYSISVLVGCFLWGTMTIGLAGCSRPSTGQPSTKELRELENVLGFAFPPGTVFRFRLEESPKDSLWYLVFDVPPGEVDTFVASIPFGSSIMKGDRTVTPLPAQIDPSVSLETFANFALVDDPVNRPLMNSDFSVPARYDIWDPDSAEVFLYGNYRPAVKKTGPRSCGSILIDVGHAPMARVYVVHIED